jgi:GGDEF domain-containing protein
LVPSSACVFYIYDVDADDLVATHASGEHAAHIKGLRIPIGQRLSGWVAANRQTIRNSDPVLDLGESARALNPRPRSCLSTPLLSGKTLVGVLSLYSSNKDGYSEDHQRILEVIARQVSAAILEAQNADRLRSRSFKDESTGLPNLRHLVEFIEAQLADDERRHPFCLVTLQFEVPLTSSLNQATESVVSATRRALRPADLLFRTAENEFVALLLNTELNAATAIGVRVASALGTLRLGGVLTNMRLGLACAPLDAAEAERLLNVSRERAINNGPTGISSPRAIH